MGVTVKVVVEDGKQVIRLPEGIAVAGSEVEVRQEGSRVIIEPVQTKRDVAKFLADMAAFRDVEFPEPSPEDDPPIIWKNKISFDE